MAITSVLHSEAYPISVAVGTADAVFNGGYERKDLAKRAGFTWSSERKKWMMPAWRFRDTIKSIASVLSLGKEETEEFISGRHNEPEIYPEHPALEWAISLLKLTPYPYQFEGINFALHNNYCIIGDEMGLGKSFQALGVMAVSGLKTVVVCPNSIKLSWEREVRKFTNLKPIVILKTADIKKIGLSEIRKADVVIINYDIIDRCVCLFADRKLFVFDEAHCLKNPASLRTKVATEMISNIRPERCLFLTGTAVKNNVGEFFSLLHLCSLSKADCGLRVTENPMYSSELRFKKFFSHEVKTNFGSKFEGLRNYAVLKRILRKKYIRHSANEHLPGLPPISRMRVLYEGIPSSERVALDELLETAVMDARSGLSASESISTAKRLSATIKVPGTINFAVNLVEQDEQVLIFSDHVDSAKRICAGLSDKGIPCALILGGMSPYERQAAVDAFQNGDAKAFVATIGAAKEGLTLTAGRYVIFNDMPWVPSDYLQSEKRAHRIGQTRNVFVYIMCAEGLDYAVIGSLMKKISVTSFVLSDGSEDPITFIDIEDSTNLFQN